MIIYYFYFIEKIYLNLYIIGNKLIKIKMSQKIKTFVEFCTQSDYIDKDMAKNTKKYREHLAKMDELIRNINDEKEKFCKKYKDIVNEITNEGKNRLKEINNPIKKEHSGDSTATNAKFKIIFEKYYKLKNDATKFLDEGVKKFNERFLGKRKRIQPENGELLTEDIDSYSESDHEITLRDTKINLESQKKAVKIIQKEFNNRSEKFISLAINERKYIKEFFFKKENLRKYENKNKVMFKFTLDSFFIERNPSSRQNLNNNINSEIRPNIDCYLNTQLNNYYLNPFFGKLIRLHSQN